jgi:hypothetical protein
MTMIRAVIFVLALVVADLVALTVVGTIILLLTAAWRCLVGNIP